MIYSRLKESAVEDAIQTPDNIGVDLDQVEKDIAGEDGIAAHQAEVEDAQEGMIGDPIEEFAMIMYENEYNYNQIMQAIGIAELNEAAMGREIIYEATDIKSFFKTIKDFIVSSFKSFTEAVMNVIAKLGISAKLDKKFVTANKEKIDAGFNTDWSIKGYDFDDIEYPTDKVLTVIGIENYLADVEKGKIGEAELAQISDEYKPENHLKRVFKHFKVDNESVATVSDFVKALLLMLAGEKKDINKSSFDNANAICAFLSGEKEINSIKKAYAEVKKAYKSDLAKVAEWEKKADVEDKKTYMHICQLGIGAIKSNINVSHAACSTYIKVAKVKRAQYRKIAHLLASKGGKQDKKEDVTVQHNSASMFSRIEMI